MRATNGPCWARRIAAWCWAARRRVLDPAALLELQRAAAAVHTAEPLLDYVQQLVAATRARRDIRLGLSPRAAQGLVRAARAWALLDGRDAVLPDDVQAVWNAVALHRLEPRSNGRRRPARRAQMLARCSNRCRCRARADHARLPRASTIAPALAALGAASPGTGPAPAALEAAPHLHPAHAQPAGSSACSSRAMFLAGMNYGNGLALLLTFWLAALHWSA